MFKNSLLVFISLVVCYPAFNAGQEEAASSSQRGRYLAGQGLIIPAEEVRTNSYIASIDYNYPIPDDDFEILLFSSNHQVSKEGQDVLLHFGIQGSHKDLSQLPPMNLVYVIDTSSSMSEQDKIDWIKQGFDIFLERVRDIDYLTLVTFSDEPKVVFSSTQMNSDFKRNQFSEAVHAIEPQGGSNLEAGLEVGYEQILANYRKDYINRVLFLSDGTEFSSRLVREGAQTGDIRISLLWGNHNDLDLHVVTPTGEEIFYGHQISRCGGFLDVDMNAGGDSSNKPIENIFWAENSASSGKYKVFVQNYAYHDRNVRGEYPFRVEVKNGDELSTFEGVVEGTGKRVDVTDFVFQTSISKKREKALIYELASTYREMGINISTIGVGVEFDTQLMTQLAKEGGGSSRFISGPEEMEKIFGSEFVRMAVPLARDLSMEFAFETDVEILNTWGYNNEINENLVTYYQPTLHLGDYETILLKFRIPPQMETEELPIGRLKVMFQDLNGKQKYVESQLCTVRVTDSQQPVTGISDATVLQSGNMMLFAESLKEISYIYYDAVDAINYNGDLETGNLKLQNALDLTVALKKQLNNVQLRLDKKDLFNDQIEILDNYIDTIGRDLEHDTAQIDKYKNDVEIDPVRIIRSLENRVYDLCNEIILELESEENPSIALSGFSSRDGKEYPLLVVLEEAATLIFSEQEAINIIERDKLDEILEEQRLSLSGLIDTDSAIEVGKLLAVAYMVTGTVIPMNGSVVIFSRLIDVESGEIINAAQVILTKSEVGELLDL